MNKALIPGGPYAAGGPAGTVPAKAIKPFPTLDLFIANEAFHPADWGEGALEMAENIAHKFFGVKPPSWIHPQTYNAMMFGAPDAPPPSPPSPSPPSPPSPPAPPGVCKAMQQKLNASTVCAESVDEMSCTIKFSCPNPGEHFVRVDFAGVGTIGGQCGALTQSSSCHGTAGAASSIVGKLCLGKSSCAIAPNTNARVKMKFCIKHEEL